MKIPTEPELAARIIANTALARPGEAARGESPDDCTARVLHERGHTLASILLLYTRGELHWEER